MQILTSYFKYFLFCLGLLHVGGCDRLTGDTTRGQLLAEVGSQQLYLGDAEGIVTRGLTSADSIQVLSDYVTRWVRDAAVSEEAIAQLGDSPEIERLVAQYRTSLARDKYETLIASQRIDTTVTPAQLEQTYENSKAGFSAKQALMRALLIKMPAAFPNQSDFDAAWKSSDDPDQWAVCTQMARAHASLALLDTAKWYALAEIEVLLPNGSLGSIREGRSVASGDGHLYYLRINELVKEGEATPLPYVRERLRKIILEQRKAAFLGTYTEEIYQAARAQNRVKIYIGNDH